MTTETIAVPEIHCDHCVQSITGAVQPLDGVDDVAVDLATTTVTVSFAAPATRDAIVAAIEDQGYVVAGDETPGANGA